MANSKDRLLPRPPNLFSDSPNVRPTVSDWLLRLVSASALVVMGFTIVRLWLTAMLLPVYLVVAFVRSLLPRMLPSLPLLLFEDVRRTLYEAGMANRKQRDDQAHAQFQGTYQFSDADIERTRDVAAVAHKVARIWGRVHRDYVEVCPGLHAAVARAGTPGGKPVLLLHGNPSWSFMYRNVIPALDGGFDIFAVDWIGFGMSDKPLVAEEISFELHMRTLLRIFENYGLKETHVLAHDWGGCVALCTLPHLAPDAVKSFMLLNSFFPPRPEDISLNSMLQYLVWMSCQGLMDGFMPESLIIRYMAPATTSSTAEGFSAPFSSWRTKKAVYRFAFLVPGMPDAVYGLFRSAVGAVIDGMCPPRTFSSLHEQIRLRERDVTTREFWASGKGHMDIAVVFGRNDPLLGDYWDILVAKLKTAEGKAEGTLLSGAGHYQTEEKPVEIADLFARFIERGTIFPKE